MFAARLLAPLLGAPDIAIAATALAVFIGHLYPVFHRFAGGKGVATAAGIVLALDWPLGIALTAVWLTMAFGFKISSLAALTTAVLLPLGLFYDRGLGAEATVGVVMALLLFWRHRTNIRELMRAARAHDRPVTVASRYVGVHRARIGRSLRRRRHATPSADDRKGVVARSRRSHAAPRPSRSSRRCRCKTAARERYACAPRRRQRRRGARAAAGWRRRRPATTSERSPVASSAAATSPPARRRPPPGTRRRCRPCARRQVRWSSPPAASRARSATAVLARRS